MNLKAITQFVAQHYERFIAVLVMLCFSIFSVILLVNVKELKVSLDQSQPPPVIGVKPANVEDLEKALKRVQSSPAWVNTNATNLLFVGPPMKEYELGKIKLVLGDYGNNSEGIPFKWLASYQFRTDGAPVGNGDPDNDGFSNLEEYTHHTDPTNHLSKPELVLKLRAVAPLRQFKFPYKFTGAEMGSDETPKHFKLVKLMPNAPSELKKLKESLSFTNSLGKVVSYKIEKYVPKFPKRPVPSIITENGTPLMREKDESELVLLDGQGNELVLVVNMEREMNEYYVQFYNLLDGTSIDYLPKGGKVKMEDRIYRISEIIPTDKPSEFNVKVVNEKGDVFDVPMISESEMAQPQGMPKEEPLNPRKENSPSKSPHLMIPEEMREVK